MSELGFYVQVEQDESMYCVTSEDFPPLCTQGATFRLARLMAASAMIDLLISYEEQEQKPPIRLRIRSIPYDDVPEHSYWMPLNDYWQWGVHA